MRISLMAPVLSLATLAGQITPADYERAMGLRERWEGLTENVPERPAWIGSTGRFWYRKSVKGGSEFVVFDTASSEKKPAFDHARLAAALSQATNQKYAPEKLPFTEITWVDEQRAIEFNVADTRWRVELSDYSCKKAGSVNRDLARRNVGVTRPVQGPPPAESTDSVTSPDGKWEAFERNYNVFLRAKGSKDAVALSYDGMETNYYSVRNFIWSPDSQRLVAWRVRPGTHRKIEYIESSPSDQLQPEYHTFEYAKPGDMVDLQQPVLFRIDSRKQINIDNTLFSNPYELSRPVWHKDSSVFTFEYNQRGHQVYRVLEVNGSTGAVWALIDEESPTFFCYSSKRFRHDLPGDEIIWMSERDGWNHLYLYDGNTGKVVHQITKGQWVVRGVDRVDDEKRQIWFRASGMYPGKDPYFVHYYRINVDGTGLVALTEADANHTLTFSPDRRFYIDTYSRVDVPTVSELHTTDDRKLVAALEKGDAAGLRAIGWTPPESFVAKGRDGKTDIYGVIIRPSHFDASRKYPVIENIYAGPQDSFVPHSFMPTSAMQSLAELGFIVVQIDGMGTSNRSKAFHDVCWKNLGDAGFPDRILWHKAVAAKYPWYDITRVGIYGHSAGGQSALGGLLFHPEFYRVAVASSGCHDNRMDKIWWNEQWMGWPLGPEYAASSNVDNASRLRGKLLLFVGELDTNVDPSSTMQVVNALIKAGKTFSLLVLPGQNHTSGGDYGERMRRDFFVHNLLGVEPPDWNKIDETKKIPGAR